MPKSKHKVELPKPTVILGGGISATGKSTFYNALIPKIFDLYHINKDTINAAFLLTVDPTLIPEGEKFPVIKKLENPLDPYALEGKPISLSNKNSVDFFQLHNKYQAYRLMLDMAVENTSHGKHSLLEGNYCKEMRWGYLERFVYPLFKQAGARVKFLWNYAPEEIIKERIIKRNAERDDSKMISEESWKNLLSQQPILPKELEKYDHLKINSIEPLEKSVQEAIEYLKI